MKIVENFSKVLVLSILSLGGCVSDFPDVIESADTVALFDVMKKMEPSLNSLNRKAKSKNLKVKSVTLEFNTTSTEKNDGSIELLIFSAGGSSKDAMTSEFKIKLTDLTEHSAETGVDEDRFFQMLEKILEGADEEIAGLGTSEITGTLKFVVERKADGGLKGFEIKPLSISMSGSVTKAYTQSVKIVISRIKGIDNAV